MRCGRVCLGVRVFVRSSSTRFAFLAIAIAFRDFVLPFDVVSPWPHFPPSHLPSFPLCFVHPCIRAVHPRLYSFPLGCRGLEGKWEGRGMDGRWRAASIRSSPLIPRSFISGFLVPLLDRSTFDVRRSCIMSVCLPSIVPSTLPACHPFIHTTFDATKPTAFETSTTHTA